MASANEQITEETLLPSGFKFHNFHDTVGNESFDCQIIKMKDCLYLWIGDRNNPSMQDLSLAIQSNFEQHIAGREFIARNFSLTIPSIQSYFEQHIGRCIAREPIAREPIAKEPIATKILGDSADVTSVNMAKRLSQKFGKSIYVSFNITVSHRIVLEIEKRIQEEFKTHPDLLCF